MSVWDGNDLGNLRLIPSGPRHFFERAPFVVRPVSGHPAPEHDVFFAHVVLGQQQEHAARVIDGLARVCDSSLASRAY